MQIVFFFPENNNNNKLFCHCDCSTCSIARGHLELRSHKTRQLVAQSQSVDATRRFVRLHRLEWQRQDFSRASSDKWHRVLLLQGSQSDWRTAVCVCCSWGKIYKIIIFYLDFFVYLLYLFTFFSIGWVQAAHAEDGGTPWANTMSLVVVGNQKVKTSVDYWRCWQAF